MDEHDLKEIEKLKKFKEWCIWYHNLSDEEKEEYQKNKWKEEN